MLIEGMTIAGLATGATRGYIYLRCEYPACRAALDAAIARGRSAGYLGENVLRSGRHFDLEVRLGAGAYICGEETSLLESLEGKRGQVRFKPPLPAIAGLFGKPTVINNVITLATVPIILDRGAEFYQNFGMGRSRGTLPIQLAGNIKHGGLVEKAFGVTLRELLYDFGGGSPADGRSGPCRWAARSGAYLPESQFDTPLDYEAFAAIGRCSATAASWSSTTRWTWPRRRATRWSSARSNPAANARPAASVPRAARVIDRLVAGEDAAQAGDPACATCATRCSRVRCARWVA